MGAVPGKKVLPKAVLAERNAAIIQEYAEGNTTYKALGEKYGRSKFLISLIVKKAKWMAARRAEIIKEWELI
jgi:hypothetical protein